MDKTQFLEEYFKLCEKTGYYIDTAYDYPLYVFQMDIEFYNEMAIKLLRDVNGQ